MDGLKSLPGDRVIDASAKLLAVSAWGEAAAYKYPPDS